MKSNSSVLFLQMMFFVPFLRTLPSPRSQPRALCPVGERCSVCHSWARVAQNLQRQDASQQGTIWSKTSVALDFGSAQGREDVFAHLLLEASLLYLLHLVCTLSVFKLCAHVENTSKSRFFHICASSLLL